MSVDMSASMDDVFASEDILRTILLAAAGGHIGTHAEAVLPFPAPDPQVIASLCSTCKAWHDVVMSARLDITVSFPARSDRPHHVAEYWERLQDVVNQRPSYLVHDISLVCNDWQLADLRHIMSSVLQDRRLNLVSVDLSACTPASDKWLEVVVECMQGHDGGSIPHLHVRCAPGSSTSLISKVETDSLAVSTWFVSAEVCTLGSLKVLHLESTAGLQLLPIMLHSNSLEELTLRSYYFSSNCTDPIGQLCEALKKGPLRKVVLQLRPPRRVPWAMSHINMVDNIGAVRKLHVQDVLEWLVLQHGEDVKVMLGVARDEFDVEEAGIIHAADVTVLPRTTARLADISSAAAISEEGVAQLDLDLSLQILFDTKLQQAVGDTPLSLHFGAPDMFHGLQAHKMAAALKALRCAVLQEIHFAPGETGGRKELKSPAWVQHHAQHLQQIHNLFVAPFDLWLASDLPALRKVTLVSAHNAAPLLPAGVTCVHLKHTPSSTGGANKQMQRQQSLLMPKFEGLPDRCGNVQELALTGYDVHRVPHRLQLLELRECITTHLQLAEGTQISTVYLMHCNRFRMGVNLVEWLQSTHCTDMWLLDTSFGSGVDVLETVRGSSVERLRASSGPHDSAVAAKRGVTPILAAVFEEHLAGEFFVQWRFNGRYATVEARR